VPSSDGGRNSRTGAFHQVEAGYAACNRQAVGFGHFGCVQEFVHGRHNDNETGKVRLPST
jgi:hypothetical protein